ncbi:hypothetical protein [Dyella nitratireducens]|uniref:Uncharacterized protein n=1 Tax=Dyella nitratireducens TaxID=1849580 RepID=A0ABQ1GPG9_9GAMM|nr:hypothetical protein [Dyella nitratireducens]GGA47497.1 hypothetical protein GCM10010981_40810 [Dyella nitratireducens]GLQ42441.1 hypothetical protein GCM10007902_22910 [Dyella nitratireducens]
MALSAPYRKIQRLLSQWLEGSRTARRQVFAIRALVPTLDATDKHRLCRWLAWWCVAAGHRGEWLLGRIERLDSALGASTEAALSQLPLGVGLSAVRQHRKSA